VNAADSWTQLATDLRDLADRVESLAGKTQAATSVQFTVQPGPWHATDVEKAAAVDTVAQALIGIDGVERPVGGKNLHHDASGTLGEISVGVFRGLSRRAGAR
jgi:hypothetical protein